MIKEELTTIKTLLAQIEEEKELYYLDKIRILFKILDDSLNLFVAQESIRFTTLFAKISWVVTKFHFSPRHNFLLQTFRRGVERSEINGSNEAQYYELGCFLCHLLAGLFQNENSQNFVLTPETDAFFKSKPKEIIGFKALIDGLIIAIDASSNQLTFISDEEPEVEFKVAFDLTDKNEMFTQNIKAALKIIELPIHANLIDVDCLKDKILHPTALILNPDYLVDVTAVANTTRDSKGEYWLYVLNKLLIKETNINLMSGNLVGGMLDQIINNEAIEFNELIETFFEEDPLKWSLYDDDEVKLTLEKLYAHFQNIKRTIAFDFKEKGLDKTNIYLEPSFYCRDYGIQGRLDLLHVKEKKQIDIIELKSGKPYNANKYGINNSHYLQTLLYDLIIKSSYLRSTKAINYIFYSSLTEDSMKFAPVTKSQQYELMKIRNEIMIMDHALAKSADMSQKVISFLKERNFDSLKGYVQGDLQKFEDIFSTLDQVEKAYVGNFISFIAKEQIIAKVGEYGSEKSNGLAGLWLEKIEDKIDRFAILNHLCIVQNNSDKALPLIEFNYSEFSATLSNFRIGDIAVLYPHSFNNKDIMHHQIFKATIVDLDDKRVIIKLRHSQKNQEVFRAYDYWNLEQDVLDSAFRHMYKNVYLFAQSDAEKRKLILGRSRPALFKAQQLVNLPSNLTIEQKGIIQKLFSCKDYMLLWGPPGTGKTSEIIKNLSLQLLENTSEKIMLIAYTNKAVDEICQALVEGGMADQVTRIGSSLSTGESYTHFLLQNKIKGYTNRKAIRDYLSKSRIVVSTLSSLLGKTEIFSLMEFDTVIVDEASQILEPMLCGLLTHFKRFILIGDHKQLPAVVAQKKAESIIKNEALIEVGIGDTRTSLFERLYLQCKAKQWFHATEILSMQGRMHINIMQFVNENFYEQKLKPIPRIDRLIDPLLRKSHAMVYTDLLNKRMLFIDTPIDPHFNYKTNIYEADKVRELIDQLVQIYDSSGLTIHANSIGVITPYRAQIALIKAKLNTHLPIVVDTVERFQGGAKDIIILSLCTNKFSQLNTLVSSSSEGIDRKLNVAITRTREQLIVLGNKEMLSSNETYRRLIEYCVEIE
jgi:DNA replication ATP-dependent helicase Dna2